MCKIYELGPNGQQATVSRSRRMQVRTVKRTYFLSICFLRSNPAVTHVFRKEEVLWRTRSRKLPTLLTAQSVFILTLCSVPGLLPRDCVNRVRSKRVSYRLCRVTSLPSKSDLCQAVLRVNCTLC
ncbi:c6.2 [Tranosema rostrale ichnovirus]|nr:c6.2 [Tranosema rostrale ichnovirus]